MVKVAICFSGTLRGFDACFPKIKTHFIDAWNVEPTYFFYGPKAKYHVGDICKDIIFEYEEQTQKTILPINPAGYGCPLEYFSWQWYNSKKSLELAFNFSQEFDAYMRIRADIYPVGRSSFNWDNFYKNLLYLPEKLSFGGVCDRIGFGSKEVMSVYANFYGSNEFYNANGNSETRMAAYLKANNIPINQIPQPVLDFCHKDEKHVIHYPGPEIEEKLITLDKEILTDKSFDRVWWRQPIPYASLGPVGRTA